MKISSILIIALFLGKITLSQNYFPTENSINGIYSEKSFIVGISGGNYGFGANLQFVPSQKFVINLNASGRNFNSNQNKYLFLNDEITAGSVFSVKKIVFSVTAGFGSQKFYVDNYLNFSKKAVIIPQAGYTFGNFSVFISARTVFLIADENKIYKDKTFFFEPYILSNVKLKKFLLFANILYSNVSDNFTDNEFISPLNFSAGISYIFELSQKNTKK